MLQYLLGLKDSEVLKSILIFVQETYVEVSIIEIVNTGSLFCRLLVVIIIISVQFHNLQRI